MIILHFKVKSKPICTSQVLSIEKEYYKFQPPAFPRRKKKRAFTPENKDIAYPLNTINQLTSSLMPLIYTLQSHSLFEPLDCLPREGDDSPVFSQPAKPYPTYSNAHNNPTHQSTQEAPNLTSPNHAKPQQEENIQFNIQANGIKLKS